MSPTVRSRLFASGTAFLFGFILANYGMWRVAGADRWLWVAIAVVLMATGAVGVMISDSPRRVSIWAIVGLEMMIAFTLVPLLWTFTVAVAPDLGTPTSVLPQHVEWSAFGDALSEDSLRRPLMTSMITALLSTVIALMVAVPAAHALVKMRVPGGGYVYLGVVTLLLAPLLVFDGAIANQLRSFGILGMRLAPVLPTLLLTLPLATWLCVSVLRDVPWTLRDAIRVEGGSRREEFRSFVVPIVGPGIGVAGLMTFIMAMNDVAVGATMVSTESSRTLPATMLLSAGELANPSSRVAAMALLLLVPSLIVLLAAPRRILLLLGRTYR